MTGDDRGRVVVERHGRHFPLRELYPLEFYNVSVRIDGALPTFCTKFDGALYIWPKLSAGDKVIYS